MLDAHSQAIVCASRLSSKGFDHVVATNTLCAHKYASHDINSRMFPVVGLFNDLLGKGLRSNIKPEILDQADTRSDLSDVERAVLFGGYVYATAMPPAIAQGTLKISHKTFLGSLSPGDPKLGPLLAELGLRLVRAHCLDSVVPAEEFSFRGSIGESITSPRWKQNTLWISRSSSFNGVEATVWEFRMSGYQVCKSWFSAGNRAGIQRRGAPITDTLVDQFRSVLWAIKETLKVRKMIDEVIDQHGGWPGCLHYGTSPKRGNRGHRPFCLTASLEGYGEVQEIETDNTVRWN